MSSNRLPLIAALLLLASTAVAQDLPRPRGIPFRIDTTKVSPDRSGWYLNLANDTRQNLGELSHNWGGASNDGVFPIERAPRWRVSAPEPDEVHHIDAGVQTYRIEDRYFVDEQDPQSAPLKFRMITPLRLNGGAPYEVMFANLDLIGTLWIDDAGTRPYTAHTRTLLDWDPTSLTSSSIPVLAKLGGTVIYIDDHNGNAPMVAATQNAMIVAKWLNETFPGAPVFHSGGSFGANVGVICSMLAPDLFTGVQSFGASLCAPFWKHYTDFNNLRSLAENGRAWIHHDSSVWDDGFTILGQHGLRRYHLDILRFPELFRTPLMMVNGRDDNLALSHNLEYTVQAQTAQIVDDGGAPYIESIVLEEGGHGLPEVAWSDAPMIRHWLQAGLRNAAHHPDVPSPYIPSVDPDNDQDFWRRYTNYDDTIRARHRTFEEVEDPYMVRGIVHLADIGAFEFGSTTPPKQAFRQRGLGTNLCRQRQTALIDDGCLITSNLEGYVTKYRLDSGQLIEEWSSFTGFNIQALHAVDFGAGPTIVVGDYRGLHYLDSDGEETHHNPKHDHIRCINSADLSAWGFANGPHVFYVADGEMLVIEDRNHAVVFEEPIGVVGRFRVRNEDHGSGARPYIYASLARGHMARFRFDPIDGKPALVADMISSYLEFQPTDFDFTSISVGGVEGNSPKVDLMVVGGREYDMDRNENGHGPEDRTCWLAVVDTDGNLRAEYPLARRNPDADDDPSTDDEIIDELSLNRVESLGGSKVLISTLGEIAHIDLSKWSEFDPDITSAGWFITGALGNSAATADTRDLATFGATGIRVLSVDSSGIHIEEQARLHTRVPTTATDLIEHDGRWELSILDVDWVMRTYDATTGRMLRAFRWNKWLPDQHPPRTLICTDPTVNGQAGFEIFDDAGIMVAEPGQPARRAAYKAGRVVFSNSKEAEHNYLIRHPEENVVAAEVQASGNPLVLSGGSASIPVEESPVMGPVTQTSRETALHQLTYPSGHSPILFGNQSGNVYWFYDVNENARSMGPWAPTRMEVTGWTSTPSSAFPAGNKKPNDSSGRVLYRGEEPLRLGCRDISVIDSADIDHDGAVEVLIGAEMANHDGHTLFLLKWFQSGTRWLECAVDAGSVTGAAVLDLDGDGDFEVVVGTQTGTVRIYDSSLKRLLREFDTGGLNAGAKGAIWVIPGEDTMGGDPLLLIGHSLGVSAYAIADFVD